VRDLLVAAEASGRTFVRSTSRGAAWCYMLPYPSVASSIGPGWWNQGGRWLAGCRKGVILYIDTEDVAGRAIKAFRPCVGSAIEPKRSLSFTCTRQAALVRETNET
jgi:hypothetical protein